MKQWKPRSVFSEQILFLFSIFPISSLVDLDGSSIPPSLKILEKFPSTSIYRATLQVSTWRRALITVQIAVAARPSRWRSRDVNAAGTEHRSVWIKTQTEAVASKPFINFSVSKKWLCEGRFMVIDWMAGAEFSKLTINTN